MLLTLLLGTNMMHFFELSNEYSPGRHSWFWEKMNNVRCLEFDSDKQEQQLFGDLLRISWLGH